MEKFGTIERIVIGQVELKEFEELQEFAMLLDQAAKMGREVLQELNSNPKIRIQFDMHDFSTLRDIAENITRTQEELDEFLTKWL
jgi:flagellar basal body P-ring protein FlgI